MVWIKILCLTVCFAFSYVHGLCEQAGLSDNGRKKWCSSEKILRMAAANCYNRDFISVPQCLRTNIEILDLSYNRVRSLSKNDLSQYTRLKILYLSDNMISRIDDDAFDNNQRLEILDLSFNGLSNLPPQVFELPSLSKLFLSQNGNMNLAEVIEISKPIQSPLVYIDIGFNELEALPDFGMMPFLLKLNVSGNDYMRMGIRPFAGLCSLKYFINHNMTAVFDDPCECWTLERWLKDRKVYFSSLECPSYSNDCTFRVPAEDMDIYNQCKELEEKLAFNSWLLKVFTPIFVILVIIALCIGVYLFMKRRKRMKRRLRDRQMAAAKCQGLLSK